MQTVNTPKDLPHTNKTEIHEAGTCDGILAQLQLHLYFFFSQKTERVVQTMVKIVTNDVKCQQIGVLTFKK